MGCCRPGRQTEAVASLTSQAPSLARCWAAGPRAGPGVQPRISTGAGRRPWARRSCLSTRAPLPVTLSTCRVVSPSEDHRGSGQIRVRAAPGRAGAAPGRTPSAPGGGAGAGGRVRRERGNVVGVRQPPDKPCGGCWDGRRCLSPSREAPSGRARVRPPDSRGPGAGRPDVGRGRHVLAGGGGARACSPHWGRGFVSREAACR